jgi:hypothetical protein
MVKKVALAADITIIKPMSC